MRHLGRAIKALNAITEEIPGEKVDIKALESESSRVSHVQGRLIPVTI